MNVKVKYKYDDWLDVSDSKSSRMANFDIMSAERRNFLSALFNIHKRRVVSAELQIYIVVSFLSNPSIAIYKSIISPVVSLCHVYG
jgi:hypothetical protein